MQISIYADIPAHRIIENDTRQTTIELQKMTQDRQLQNYRKWHKTDNYRIT